MCEDFYSQAQETKLSTKEMCSVKVEQWEDHLCIHSRTEGKLAGAWGCFVSRRAGTGLPGHQVQDYQRKTGYELDQLLVTYS